MKRYAVVFIAAAAASLYSCRNDTIVDPGPTPQSDRGVFIINQGAFPNAGSLSFYNITRDSVTQNVVGPSAGWITPNDAKVVGKKLYVVVNGGDKIYVRNTDTFQPIDSIQLPAHSAPGYIVTVDSTRAYVANYNGTVTVINLTQNTVIQTSAPVVRFPGGITVNAGKVYVSDFGYYPDYRNVVKVLNMNTLAVVDSAVVGVAAGSMVSSGSAVFVVCAGSYPSRGKVYTIDVSVDSPVDSVTVGEGPTNIAVWNLHLYVLHGDRVMRLATTPLSVSDSSFITLTGGEYFYGMQIDAGSGEIYVSKVVSTGGSGEVEIHQPAGPLRRPSFPVGYFPGAFAFKGN